MTMPPNTFGNTNDKAKDAANQTINDIKDKANDAKSGLQNAAANAGNIACKAGKNADAFVNAIGDRICSTSDSVAAEIRKNPVQSAFIALAIGVIGTLFYRRSS